MDKALWGLLRSQLSEIKVWREMAERYEAGEDVSHYMRLETALKDAKSRGIQLATVENSASTTGHEQSTAEEQSDAEWIALDTTSPLPLFNSLTHLT